MKHSWVKQCVCTSMVLCPAHLQILIKLSAALRPKTSSGEKDGNPQDRLLFGKHHTGQNISAPPKFISGAEKLIKSLVSMKKQQKKKNSKTTQWNESSNGYSQPLQQTFEIWSQYLDKRQIFTSYFCDIWEQNPRSCRYLLYITSCLPLTAAKHLCCSSLKK